MSKIGKIPVKIPNGVEVNIDNGFIVIKGPKGELKQLIHRGIDIKVADNKINIEVSNTNDRSLRSLWGLTRSLINNMVIGVTQGYEKKLEVNGVGYRVALKGDRLNLEVGFSHPVEFKLPKGLEAKVEKNVITVAGIDKQQVGEISAQIRKIKPPEPYKGKGIKYLEETIRRKAGKVMKSAEGGGK